MTAIRGRTSRSDLWRSVRRQTKVAAAEFRRALELNPNFAAAHGYLGLTLAFDDQSDEATKHLEEAILMSPHEPTERDFQYRSCGHPLS